MNIVDCCTSQFQLFLNYFYAASLHLGFPVVFVLLFSGGSPSNSTGASGAGGQPAGLPVPEALQFTKFFHLVPAQGEKVVAVW